jgi:predicted RNase H-like HicB family nuclease
LAELFGQREGLPASGGQTGVDRFAFGHGVSDCAPVSAERQGRSLENGATLIKSCLRTVYRAGHHITGEKGGSIAMEKEYELILIPQAEGGFVVTVPELPDVVTEGETVDDAVAMAKDAIEGYLETMHDHGWTTTPPRRARVVVHAP